MDEKPAANEVSRNGLLFYYILSLFFSPHHIYLFFFYSLYRTVHSIFCWHENYLLINILNWKWMDCTCQTYLFDIISWNCYCFWKLRKLYYISVMWCKKNKNYLISTWSVWKAILLTNLIFNVQYQFLFSQINWSSWYTTQFKFVRSLFLW